MKLSATLVFTALANILAGKTTFDLSRMGGQLGLSLLLLTACTGSTYAWNAGPKECRRQECGNEACRGGACFNTEEEHWLNRVYAADKQGNMHPWLVNRALNLLANSSDPAAKQAVERLRRPACADRWMDGLWDADAVWELQEVDGALRPAGGHGEHFYNAARLDYDGRPTNVLGYLWSDYSSILVNLQDTSDLSELGKNARNAAMKEFRHLRRLSGDMDADSPCYRLGVLLHYLTDLTQPMHTSNFSAANSPIKLHVDYEDWVSDRQFAFEPNIVLLNTPTTRVVPMNLVWDERWKNLPFETVIYQTAHRSNVYAPHMMKTLVPLYNWNYSFWGAEAKEKLLRDRWMLTREIVFDAIQSTASAIYSISNSIREGQVIRNPQSGAIYYDDGRGNTLHVPTIETLEALGFTISDVVNTQTAPLTPLVSYPALQVETEVRKDYPDLHFGRLLIDTRGTMYMLDRGQRRGIESLNVLALLGLYRSAEATRLADQEMDRIPLGAPIRMTDFIFEGQQVRDPATGQISRITQGRRKPIPSPATFFALGQRELWRNHADIKNIPEAPAYPELVPDKYVRDPASGAVYLLREGLKHHVATQYTMDTLGMSWANVVNHDRLDRVPDGFSISLRPALWPSWIPYN